MLPTRLFFIPTSIVGTSAWSRSRQPTAPESRLDLASRKFSTPFARPCAARSRIAQEQHPIQRAGQEPVLDDRLRNARRHRVAVPSRVERVVVAHSRRNVLVVTSQAARRRKPR